MQDATTASIVNGLLMVVHLHAVRQVTAAGFGVLLGARRQLLEAGLSLSLAGVSLRTRFTLYAWRLQRLFDEWQPAISRGRSLAPQAGLPVRIALRGEQDALPAQTRIRG
jgi:anti-anti-sigma regulatory factor